MWWDARKLVEPIEVLILDLSKTENVDEPEWAKWARSHGVSCMDYDPSIPIRFMVCMYNRNVYNQSFYGKTIDRSVNDLLKVQFLINYQFNLYKFIITNKIMHRPL